MMSFSIINACTFLGVLEILHPESVTTMTDSITTMSGIRRGLVNQLN